MNGMLTAMIALTCFSAAGLAVAVAATLRARMQAMRMLEAASLGAGRLDRFADRRAEFQEAVLRLAAKVRARWGRGEDAKLVDRFVSAGLNRPAARDLYSAARMLGPLAGLIAGSLLPSHRSFWMMFFAGVLYLGPDIALQRIVKRRREKIRLSIPDAIDLLVICVDAGLGMDQAMLRVGQELATSHREIYEEFQQINLEQRAGKLRLDAWRSMAQRTALPEVDAFVNMLMQTERFGTPVARALSEFAEGIRQKRRQRAEELAAKTTVKIIFPLVLFIFPSMFLVLLGPAAINISRGLAGGSQ